MQVCFFNTSRGDKQKNSARLIRIYKYAFSKYFKTVEARNCVSIFRFITMLFWIFEKGTIKNSAKYFAICKHAFFNIWKENKQKNFTRCFEIRKYAFFNIWKREKLKNCASYFEILKFAFFNIWKGNNQNMLFLIFQKGIRKKTVLGLLELISIFVLTFGKGISKKLWLCWGSRVCFF